MLIYIYILFIATQKRSRSPEILSLSEIAKIQRWYLLILIAMMKILRWTMKKKMYRESSNSQNSTEYVFMILVTSIAQIIVSHMQIYSLVLKDKIANPVLLC